jgi:hypothetical protein
MPVAAVLSAIAAFSFLSGGYILTRSAPVAIVFLLLAAVWAWLLRRGSWPPPLLLAALVALGVFTAWAGISTLWSFGPDLSWVAFDLAAFYLAVLAVVGLTPMRRLQLRFAGWGFLVVAGAVAVYAFLGKGLPDVVRHANTYARLDSPIGYWNVLALVMVIGLVVALSQAGDRALHPLARGAASSVAVPMAFTFFFTFSRGGWLVLAVALLVYFVLTPARLAGFVALLTIVAPAGLVLWRLRGLRTLFSATTDAALRAAEGHTLLRWAIAALLVTAGAQVGAALVQGAVPWPRWSRLVAGTALIVILIGGATAGSLHLVESRGGVSWLRERAKVALNDSDTAASSNDAGRLGSLNTGRPPLWREALQQSRSVRLAGTGAGTFAFTHYRFRAYGGVVRHAHNQWLNVLSELGVVGLVLFVAAMALLVAVCIGDPFAHRRDPMRPLLAALSAGVIAFVVHISWDWDWDMAAAGAIVFMLAGLAASYRATRAADARAREAREAAAGGLVWEPVAAERDEAAAEAPAELGGAAPADVAEPIEPGAPSPAGPAEDGGRAGLWPLRVAASLALVLLAMSWALPFAAATAEDAAVSAAGKGQAARAVSDARRAARLDPLAVSPLLTESLALQQLGRDRAALATLRAAQALQPDDFEIYYQEGLLQLKAFGRRQAALDSFRRALALNPLDSATRDEVRALLGAD